MQVHGQKTGGGFGVLNLVELTALIHNHCPPGVDAQHAQHLATHIQNHNGVPGGGSGATKFTYNHNVVFHYTCHGRARRGATIFFAQAAHGIATIVAIGIHAPAGNETYNLHWRKGNWLRPQIML